MVLSWYSLYEEDSMNDETILEKKGLRILASHEVIIPDSLEDMSWEIGSTIFNDPFKESSRFYP
jgi:hypothetical protein